MIQRNKKRNLFDEQDHKFLQSQGLKYSKDNQQVVEDNNFSQEFDSKIYINETDLHESIQKPYLKQINSQRDTIQINNSNQYIDSNNNIIYDINNQEQQTIQNQQQNIINNQKNHVHDTNHSIDNSKHQLKSSNYTLEESIDDSFSSNNEIYRQVQQQKKLQNIHKKKFSARTTGDIYSTQTLRHGSIQSTNFNYNPIKNNKSVTVDEKQNVQHNLSSSNFMEKSSPNKNNSNYNMSSNNNRGNSHSASKATSQTKTLNFNTSMYDDNNSEFNNSHNYPSIYNNHPHLKSNNNKHSINSKKSVKTDFYMEKFQQEDEIVQKRKNMLKQKQSHFQKIIRQVKLNIFFSQSREKLDSYKFHHLKISHFKMINDYYYKLLKRGIKPKNEYDLKKEKEKQQSLQNCGRKTIINFTKLTTILQIQKQNPFKYNKFVQFVNSLFSDLQKGKCLSFLQKIPKMHPDHPLSIFLDITSFIFIIIIIFFINLFWSFDKDLDEFENFQGIAWSMLIYFFFEVILRLNTGIIQEAKIKYEASVILSNYKSKFMIQDLLAIICGMIVLIRYKQHDWLAYTAQLMLNFKIISYIHIKEMLEHRVSMRGIGSHTIQLIQMLWNILTLSHFIAIMWHGLQLYQINHGEQSTWAELSLLLSDVWYVRYLKSMFWANGLIMLIGANGETPLEVLFKTITVFFTVGIFAYILENISQLLRQLTKDTQQYKTDLQIINKYMNNKNLDSSTQINVRKHLEHCYKSIQEININTQASQVLQHLPFYLRTKIRDEINGSIVKKFILLINNFSEQTINNMLNIMQEVTYVSQDLVFSQDQSQETYMYIILTGEVELFYTCCNKKNEKQCSHKIKIIQKGDIFGENEFFTGLSPSYSAKATKFSNIVKIKRSQFMNLLYANQRDYEKFCVIKDHLIQNGVTKYFQTNCQICDSQYHSLQYCSLLNYKPQRYKFHLKLQQENNQKQDRQRYFRDQKQVNIPTLQLIQNLTRLNQHFRNKYQNIAIEYDKNYINDLEYMYKTTMLDPTNTIEMDITPTNDNLTLRRNPSIFSSKFQAIKMADSSIQNIFLKNLQHLPDGGRQQYIDQIYEMSGLEDEEYITESIQSSNQVNQKSLKKIYDTYQPSDSQNNCEIFTFEQKGLKQTTQEGFPDLEFTQNIPNINSVNNNKQNISNLNMNMNMSNSKQNFTNMNLSNSNYHNAKNNMAKRKSLGTIKQNELKINTIAKDTNNNHQIQEILSPCTREKEKLTDISPSLVQQKRPSFPINIPVEEGSSQTSKKLNQKKGSNIDQNISISSSNINSAFNIMQEKRRTSQATSQLNSPFFKKEYSKDTITTFSSKNPLLQYTTNMNPQNYLVQDSMASLDQQTTNSYQNKQFLNYLQDLVQENRKIQEKINQNQLFLEFDMQKDFQLYFTAFNLSRLIKKYNDSQLKHQQILEKRKSQRLIGMRSKDFSQKNTSRNKKLTKLIKKQFNSLPQNYADSPLANKNKNNNDQNQGASKDKQN